MRNVFGTLMAATLVFGLGLGAAFGGGVFYGRRTATPPPTPAPATASGIPGGGFPGAGATGGAAAGAGGAGGAPTVGVIDKIEGSKVTLRTQSGMATINLAADTQIRQQTPAQTTDLKAGQSVTVTGAAGADGAIQARSLTINPAGQGGSGR
ncbi:MAG: hypothetical protein U0531_16860 [Dehalococcoidia bacterium]